jgi:hypothetical protein
MRQARRGSPARAPRTGHAQVEGVVPALGIHLLGQQAVGLGVEGEQGRRGEAGAGQPTG